MKLSLERLWGLSLLLVPLLLLTTKNGSVIAVALALLLSIHFLTINRNHITITKLDILFTICFSAYFISVIPITLIDGDSYRYFRGGSRILPAVLIYLALKNLAYHHTKARDSIEWGVIWGTWGAFFLALYQYIIEGRPRVDGFLYSINFGYLSCALTLLALCLTKKSPRKRMLYICFIAGCLSTLMTLTRGAMFAMPLLIVISLWLGSEKLNLRAIIGSILGILIVSIALYYYSPGFQKRIDYTHKEVVKIATGDVSKSISTGGRIQLWLAASEALKHRPLVGSTYDERERQIARMHESGELSAWPVGVSRGHAHSQYFEMLASGGTLGIAAFALMLFTPLIYFLRYSRQSDYAYIGAVFVSGFCIYCITEVALQQNLISTFYGFMLAVFLAFTHQELAQKRNSSP